MSTSYGLERTGALSHLDMQSVCGNAGIHGKGLESQLTRLALQPAAVAKLAALSGTLQTLRLAYYEDVPYHIVRLHKYCMTVSQICGAPNL